MVDRLRKTLHGSVRQALWLAWELDNVEKADRPLRNFAHRLEQEASCVATSILWGST
jgi:hypothetical protein